MVDKSGGLSDHMEHRGPLVETKETADKTTQFNFPKTNQYGNCIEPTKELGLQWRKTPLEKDVCSLVARVPFQE